LAILGLGISQLHAMRLPWSAAELVGPDGQRRKIITNLGFTAPLDAPATVSFELAPGETIATGSQLAFTSS
jgi:hypothetical protein